MEKFAVNFKNDNDKKIVLLTLLLGIPFSWIAFVITAFGFKNDLSEQSQKIINAFLNFDLVLFIIAFVVGMIPILNLLSLLIAPILFIINLIIILKAISAINNKMTEVEIPVIFSIF